MDTLFWLLVGHAVGDFAMQSDWMVMHKSRHVLVPSARSKQPELIWLHVLTAHSLIHGGIVALATGSVVLGLLETAAHWLIDFAKCEEWFGFHTDQGLHLSCKLIWFMLFIQGWV